MKNCRFVLNGQPLSDFVCGSSKFPAFSGRGGNVNKRIAACVPNKGPIPPGEYYIVDRQSGGFLGPLKDFLTDRDRWFALYAIDGSIDDETFCDKVKRGQFRLHPEGPLGISEGCITIKNKTDFDKLYIQLKNTEVELIPSIGIKAYGKVVVI